MPATMSPLIQGSLRPLRSRKEMEEEEEEESIDSDFDSFDSDDDDFLTTNKNINVTNYEDDRTPCVNEKALQMDIRVISSEV